jgi:hypothetical protein
MEGRSFASFGISVGAVAIAAVLYGSAARADGYGRADEYGQANEYSQILLGYKIISEIFPKNTKLNFTGKDLALVGLGSYLVNSTGCNDCHTHPNWAAGGNPYMGQPKQINTAQYLSGGRDFTTPAGTFRSANLTPDKNGRPAGLTLQEFLVALQTGHDPADGDILQVMPWPLYQWKTKRDLAAMYEYLEVIPSLPDNNNPGP